GGRRLFVAGREGKDDAQGAREGCCMLHPGSLLRLASQGQLGTTFASSALRYPFAPAKRELQARPASILRRQGLNRPTQRGRRRTVAGFGRDELMPSLVELVRIRRPNWRIA